MVSSSAEAVNIWIVVFLCLSSERINDSSSEKDINITLYKCSNRFWLLIFIWSQKTALFFSLSTDFSVYWGSFFKPSPALWNMEQENFYLMSNCSSRRLTNHSLVHFNYFYSEQGMKNGEASLIFYDTGAVNWFTEQFVRGKREQHIM